MESNVGFNIIQKLNSSQYSFTQSFEERYMDKVIANNSLLIAMKYSLQISYDHQETLLVFATPLEHQLNTHIIFEEKSIIYHIEHNSKQYLIAHNHIQYLNNAYTLLDTIEAELLNGISYSTSFKKEFELHLPLSKEQFSIINTIQIVDDLSSQSHLLTPHLSLEHAHHSLIYETFPLNNIITNLHFVEKIYEFIHFSYSAKHPTFAQQEIFQIVNDNSIVLNSQSRKSTTQLIIEPKVTYYLDISPNSVVPLITTQPSDYPLPLFISSQNSFVEIANANEFRTITGREFQYSQRLFQSIIIKDKYSNYSTYANLFLNSQFIDLLNSQPTHIYSSPQEYHLKKALSNSSPKFKPMQQPFSITIEQLIQDIISFIQEKMIETAQFPEKSINTPLSYFLLNYVSIFDEMLSNYDNYQDYEIMQQIEDTSIQILNCIYKFEMSFKELYELCAVLFSIVKLNSTFKLALNINNSFFEQFDVFKSREFTHNLILQEYDTAIFEPYFETILQLNALHTYLNVVDTICIINDESYQELLKNTKCQVYIQQNNQISQQINLEEFSFLLETPHLSIYINN